MAVAEVVWVAVLVMAVIGSVGTQEVSEGEPPVIQSHRVVLDSNFVLMWTPRDDHIEFEVQVATQGYVGLGFSPNGGMKGADIVLGWVDDAGTLFLQDRHGKGNFAPLMDESQDVTLLGGYQNDTHTSLRFSRRWDTCDKTNDYVLSGNTVKVIWAYSNTDPASETDLHYHDTRGTKSLYLKAPHFELPSLGPDVKSWDFLASNISLPDHLDTLYWCKIYKVPPVPIKSHIIAYVPIIEKENEEHVHHILFYECHVPDSERHFEKWLDWEGTQCYSANMPNSWKYCKSILVGWAVGGEGEIIPEAAGFPIGEEHGGATYFMMEMHYDNPNLRQGIVDSSGLRIFYTEKLRQHDAGMLMVGHHVSPLQIVPPGQPRFMTGSFCDGSWTQQSLPEIGVRIFQGLLHTHLLGTSVKLRHIRNGHELPPILQDMNYDFNYQSGRILNNEVTLLPGDSLITECYYNSSTRTKPTFGGLGTEDEMCLVFLSYYPRVSLFSCTSQPQIRDIGKVFGMESLINNEQLLQGIEHITLEQENIVIDEQAEREKVEKIKNREAAKTLKPIKFSFIFGGIKITAPEKYANRTVYDVLHDEATWQDSTVIDAMQRVTTSGIHSSVQELKKGSNIIKNVKHVSYPSFTALSPEPDLCN